MEKLDVNDIYEFHERIPTTKKYTEANVPEVASSSEIDSDTMRPIQLTPTVTTTDETDSDPITCAQKPRTSPTEKSRNKLTQRKAVVPVRKLSLRRTACARSQILKNESTALADSPPKTVADSAGKSAKRQFGFKTIDKTKKFTPAGKKQMTDFFPVKPVAGRSRHLTEEELLYETVDEKPSDSDSAAATPWSPPKYNPDSKLRYRRAKGGDKYVPLKKGLLPFALNSQVF